MTAKNAKRGVRRHADMVQGQDRRRHPRFAVVQGMVEPININIDSKPARSSHGTATLPKSQPAILTDLSAGGMSLILFMAPPKTKTLDMMLNIPGLAGVAVEGQVVRINQKGETYNVGISFTKISKKHQESIDRLAQDNLDCDIRVALKLPEACVSTCKFHALCAKPQKGPYWK
jgi:hypothetical protein